MAQTKPKAAQFYGVPGNGTAGQVLISDGNGGMTWGANTEEFTVSWNTPTGQGLTYTQPSPQSSVGTAGSAFPSTTFTVTKSDSILSGTATIAGLPTGIVASQSYNNTGIGNILTVTLTGNFPGADSLNTDLTLSGLAVSKTVSWATPTGQSLTYTQPSPQSSSGNPGTAFPTTTFTATKSGEAISGTATITGLPTGITATQSLSGSGANNVLTVTLTGVFPEADSLNTALTISGLTIAPPLTVDYLVVAGGGSGGGGSAGSGGAGGAGGYRTNYGGTALALDPLTNYTVTVGAGAATGGISSSGNEGSSSVFSTITSAGGGRGGYSNSLQASAGGSGGGGHGANGANGSPGAGNTPSTSPSQGNTGGTGNGTSGIYTWAGAGGGGALAVGADASGNNPGNGGNGTSNSITGSAVVYAGGGGGGSWTAGTSNGNGGTGGGGDGGKGAGSDGSSGTANKGGGGGGGGQDGAGGAGGSGIVVARYPDAYNITVGSGLTTGTLNTTVGSNEKYTTFTGGTGTITFGAA